MKIKFIGVFMILLSLTRVWAGSDVKPSLNKGSLNDSIIVRFGNKTRMVIYGENKRELEKILKYDLNTLLKDLKVRLDSSQQDTTLIVEEFSGTDYLKNKPDLADDKNYVRIGGRGLHIKNGNKSVSIDQGTVTVIDEGENGSIEKIGRAAKMYVPSWGSSPRKGFNVSLGLNAYGSNTPMMSSTNPSTENAMPDLKPWGSRYVSLGYVASTTIATGQKARLHLDFGIDFSWYNLMFQDSKKIEKSTDMTYFAQPQDAGNYINLKKSKFTVPYVNLSFMPTLSFRRSFISHVSAGAYGGYRLGSYSKTIAEGSKDKKFNRTNFFVNDFRYGLGFELGIRRFPDLFVNYDLNNLYETNRGPAVKMLSFGIKLF
ncbi:outer membrane beta-barrel protein [Dyadobacter sp. CY356]|uniref:outer membrane beta-barrel protein n=1 Tax=Dyadobacter sp. CY356 TaxID=2906442 RepID=UPI001F432342|nr:outer membrane beta-barrel protein [Dyadobacter sp. CY356]MCF0057703.1 PorT family protein [Dyadobacter sp. CY356]